MKKAFIILLLLTLGMSSNAQIDARMKDIQTIFKRMELSGVDVNVPLLYGYFFYDKDLQRLTTVKDKLLAQKYQLVRMEKGEDGLYVLHVQKVEKHSALTLYQRDKKFREISSYDGWDVGNPDKTKPLTSREKYLSFVKSIPQQKLFAYAVEVYNQEMYEEAVIAFDNCIQRGIKTDTCYYKLGNSLTRVGNINLGITQLEKAIQINPLYYSAYFNIAAVCYDNNMFEKSAMYYEKAIKLKPKDDRAHYGLAAAQFALGKITESAKNCQKALDLNPSNENALVLTEMIKKRQSK